jgi:hypothetical protein
MQEDGAAAAGDARAAVVVDLDNEIIEPIVARQAVAATTAFQPHGPIVVAAGGVFAPGVFRADGAYRQKRGRPRVAVGAPPQSPRPERALGGAAIAFAFVGENAAAPECNRDGVGAGREPAAAAIAGGGTNADRRQRPITAGRRVNI